MIFNNQQCFVLTCRDICQINENAKLAAENQMLALMSSSVSHEIITPIKCICSTVDIIKGKTKDKSIIYNLELINNTAQMLLSQVKGNLDRNLLHANQFSPQIEEHKLISGVI